MRKVCMLFCVLGFVHFQAVAQYDILIKGGHVIDPKNNIDKVMDVAISGNKVAAVAERLSGTARQVVDAKGMYVMPGLIDIHAHLFWGTNMDQTFMNGPRGIMPDGFTFRNGITTIVDAGSSGWRRFADFKKQTIDFSQTRVLAFLNIVGEGMRGGAFEQNLDDMDPKVTGEFIRAHSKDIVGVKLAHYNGHDWTPTVRSIEAGKIAGVPVMVDFGSANPPLSLDSLFNVFFRPGDIYTHCFGQSRGGREFIVDTLTGKVKPFVWKAQQRGVIFDVGYGNVSLAFSQAVPAVRDGFYPDAISTDMHNGSYNAAMKNILETMSKFVAMGMPMKEVVRATTWKPAQVIQREELGHLTVGAGADVTILKGQKGNFGFFDFGGHKIDGKERFHCEMTIRDGRIVYDLNGIATPVMLPRF